MIEVHDLVKVFHSRDRAIRAVNGISFTVNPGEILGFLGPNGAGKSTTMKMITGYLKPTSGKAAIAGFCSEHQGLDAKMRLGYMPENAPLYEEMKVHEFVKFSGALRGVANDKISERVDEMLTICQLREVVDQTIETLSKGYKRRVALAQALVHDPEVLVLDEATDGLDPNQKHEVRGLIKKLSRGELSQGKPKTVIFSTHILEEVEAICDRVILIAKGKILFSGTPQTMKSKSQSGNLTDVFRALTTGETVTGVNL